MGAAVEVEIDEAAATRFDSLPPRARSLVTEALSLDVRPAVRMDDSGRVFGAHLCGYNIRFVMEDPTCRILAIEPVEETPAGK